MNYYEQAAERLRKESASVTGAKASAMKAAVRDALLQFARQDEEFAQAIAARTVMANFAGQIEG